VAYLGIFFWGGGGTNVVEDRGQREWGSGGGCPGSGVMLNLQVSETCILIGLLRIIFHGIGNLAQLCQYFRISGGGGVEPPTPLLRYATANNLFVEIECLRRSGSVYSVLASFISRLTSLITTA
jgi:hypothetical protein